MIVRSMLLATLAVVATAGPAAWAKPPAQAADAPVSARFEDCRADKTQARYDRAARTVFVSAALGSDSNILKCLNKWGDRNAVRVILEPVIE